MEKFFDAVRAVFTAVAGLLVATKRCIEVWTGAINMDITRSDLSSNRFSMFNVTRLNIT